METSILHNINRYWYFLMQTSILHNINRYWFFLMQTAILHRMDNVCGEMYLISSNINVTALILSIFHALYASSKSVWILHLHSHIECSGSISHFYIFDHKVKRFYISICNRETI